MALIKCVECGKEVSDRAATCPGCGCPIENGDDLYNRKNEVNSINRNKTLIGIFIGVSLIIVIIVVGLLNSKEPLPSGVTKDAYKYGVKALSITDQYLSTNLSGEEASEKLEQIEVTMRLILDEAEMTVDNMGDSSIWSNIMLTSQFVASENIEMVKQQRTGLAKILEK